MADMTESIEIARSPAEVFAYMTDPANIPKWQESAVSARPESEGEPRIGAKLVVTRRVPGAGERDMTSELTAYDPPRRMSARGIDGPVRANVEATVEPLDDGRRSRVTISLDFVGHGIGKILAPLLVRPRVRKELPKNMETLKRQLESGAAAS